MSKAFQEIEETTKGLATPNLSLAAREKNVNILDFAKVREYLNQFGLNI